MTDMIVKPVGNYPAKNTVQGTPKLSELFVPEKNAKMPQDALKNDESTNDASEEKLEDTEAKPFAKKTFPDGSSLEWDWSKEGVQIHEHPLFFVARDAMGIEPSNAVSQAEM